MESSSTGSPSSSESNPRSSMKATESSSSSSSSALSSSFSSPSSSSTSSEEMDSCAILSARVFASVSSPSSTSASVSSFSAFSSASALSVSYAKTTLLTALSLLLDRPSRSVADSSSSSSATGALVVSSSSVFVRSPLPTSASESGSCRSSPEASSSSWPWLTRDTASSGVLISSSRCASLTLVARPPRRAAPWAPCTGARPSRSRVSDSTAAEHFIAAMGRWGCGWLPP
mmetsp:Transcript_35630/g.91619  ORF Transcript_35630/g.91619 Transcript_35630/m.91619 type:complete len:230 (+) Transcript_35630:502-1191(+)